MPNNLVVPGLGLQTTGGGYGTPGTLYTDAANGLGLQAAAGTAYDFVLSTPTGAFAILRVPTGTKNVELANGSLLVPSGSVKAGAPTVANAAVAIKESSTYGYGVSIENRDSSRKWGFAVDRDTVGDGRFALLNITAGVSPFYVDPTSYVTTIVYGLSIQSAGLQVQAGSSSVQALSATALTLSGFGGGTGVVSVGASDSAGTGFRTLRVPN